MQTLFKHQPDLVVPGDVAKAAALNRRSRTRVTETLLGHRAGLRSLLGVQTEAPERNYCKAIDDLVSAN